MDRSLVWCSLKHHFIATYTVRIRVLDRVRVRVSGNCLGPGLGSGLGSGLCLESVGCTMALSRVVW